MGVVANFFARDYMETPSKNPGYAPENALFVTLVGPAKGIEA